MFIIDANNLAGKLNLLHEKNFDGKLIDIIREFNREKQRKIVLVFDSNDVMGDKLADGRLTIVYTPRDSFYRNADDKIVELIRDTQARKQKEEIVVVTDDMEIKKKAEELKCTLLDATKFARTITERMEEDFSGDERTGLSDDEEESINTELLHKWK